MYLPASWRGIAKFMFVFRDDYEPELGYLDTLLSPGNTFIDVGASFGIYTLVASKLVGSGGRVIAFEPTSQSFAILQQNIGFNRLTNILALRLALSQQGGRARLYLGAEPGSNSLGRAFPYQQTAEEVRIESLDNVLHQESAESVDVIKMDVEGAEELVLRGASNILTARHPTIIFEIAPERTAPLGLSPDGAWGLLDGFGYSFYVVDHDGVLSQRKSPPVNRNVVAIYGK